MDFGVSCPKSGTNEAMESQRNAETEKALWRERGCVTGEVELGDGAEEKMQ